MNIELAQKIINILNELLESDRPVNKPLIANRIPCNEDFANYPDILVWVQNNGFHIGILGLLNGVGGGVGFDYHGSIEAVFEKKDGKLNRLKCLRLNENING
jgi:hypothetical protein